MYNDVLEKITEDYFKSKGYFTFHNVPYSLSTQHVSDIDVMGINPLKKENSKIIVVSCKSWDGGLDLKKILKLAKNPPKERIRSGLYRPERFKEIIYLEWIQALKAEVEKLTGEKTFTFYFSAVKFTHEELKEEFVSFCKTKLIGCEVKLLPFKQIVDKIQNDILENKSTRPLESEIGRIIQLIHYSGGTISYH
ncbi:MAG: hypothetical protein WCF92_02010 [bacterium]